MGCAQGLIMRDPKKICVIFKKKKKGGGGVFPSFPPFMDQKFSIFVKIEKFLQK
jgi:hypothetical protein